MNIWEAILMFFSFQAVLLSAVFLLKSKGHKYSNHLFAIFLFLFAFNLFYSVIYWSKINLSILAGFAFTYPLILSLYGPVFLFYIRSIVTGKRVELKDLFHLIPTAVVLVCYSGFYILPLSEKLRSIQENDYEKYIFPIPYIYYILTGIMLAYGIYIYNRFVKHYENDRDLRIWLKAISIFYILFVSGFITYYFLVLLNILKPEQDYYISLFMVLFISMVTYFSMMQPYVFNGKPIEKVLPLVKYEKTGLSESFSYELREKLILLMEREKPYLNQNLRLQDIAELLDISRHHASQIINEHFDLSFFDFVNKYRIMEAERLLECEVKKSISEIAYESGFNNRVSFYKAFKKINGLTPTHYRVEHPAN